MLTVPPFEYHAPKSVDEAVGLLASHRGDVKVLAGGTDLVPNMKHRLFTPGHVVGLKGVVGLDQVIEEAAFLRIGSMVTLAKLAEHPAVLGRFPALAAAARQVAGPQLREMGTLGGNVCLDTRCVYYNQTYFWRQALGFCLKKDGTVCHVVKTGKRCVAAASNDTAPVLLCLNAEAVLFSQAERRVLPLRSFYVPDGITNTVLRPDELLTELRIPLGDGTLRTGYQKLRIRAAIDYPALTVAVAYAQDPGGKLTRLAVVVSALGARPHMVGGLDSFLGRPFDAAVIAEVCAVAKKQCHPLTNINVDPGWRREMVPVFVRRAFESAASSSGVR